MNSLIRERLEKIERGAVPEGYKETKIGIIPEDWEIKMFKEEFKVSQGLQIPIKDRFKEKIENSHVYITNEYINNLNNSNYNREYIENPKSSVLCDKKDILMTRTGNTGIVISKVEGVFHNNFFKIEYDEKENSQDFLIYLLKANFMQHKILALAGVGTIPDLTHSDFYSLESPFPSLQEQEQIANILSTWDKAIENIEKLIKEKEIQKKGLMQELLTGKTRLPGFNGKWEEVKLGEVLKVRHGKDQKKVEVKDGKYPILGTGGIIGRSNQALFDKESVLIGRKGTIDRPYYMNEPFWTIDTLFYTDIDDNYANVKYVFYKFNTIIWYRYNAASGVPSLSARTIESIKIVLPPLPEQKAIAEILSTADKEIELLNVLLENKKEEKKGLMQLLLTGIVRV